VARPGLGYLQMAQDCKLGSIAASKSGPDAAAGATGARARAAGWQRSDRSAQALSVVRRGSLQYRRPPFITLGWVSGSRWRRQQPRCRQPSAGKTPPDLAADPVRINKQGGQGAHGVRAQQHRLDPQPCANQARHQRSRLCGRDRPAQSGFPLFPQRCEQLGQARDLAPSASQNPTLQLLLPGANGLGRRGRSITGNCPNCNSIHSIFLAGHAI